tara:strand:- start:804 stop:1985 length:1182 start_codon:yes stop_codon:yes gene_type:complete
MARINNKVELLRALERTEEQFNALIEKNCEGKLHNPITVVTPITGGVTGGGGGGVNTSVQPTIQGQTFSKEDKEFLEAFKKIYQLGLFQLDIFIKKLMTGSQMLDEYSILYYIQQLYNGPYAKYVKRFAQFQGIFQLCPDCLGIISTVSRSNSSTPVFNGVAAAVSVGVLDKSPTFIQRELNIMVQTTTEVFNHNFQSSIFGDNTLPYIDKLPGVRVIQEGITGYSYGAVGNYMLKDVKAFNVIRSITQSIINIVRAFLGSDAFRLLQFKKNINYFNAEQNVSSTSNDSISRLLVFMDQVVSETDNIELKEKCIEIQTGLTGNVVVNNDTLGSGGLLDGSNLYTVEGRLGDRSGSPVTSLTGATIVLPPTAFPPTGPPEADCPVECDDTTLQY